MVLKYDMRPDKNDADVPVKFLNKWKTWLNLARSAAYEHALNSSSIHVTHPGTKVSHMYTTGIQRMLCLSHRLYRLRT